jgi:hypothetical protein
MNKTYMTAQQAKELSAIQKNRLSELNPLLCDELLGAIMEAVNEGAMCAQTYIRHTLSKNYSEDVIVDVIMKLKSNGFDVNFIDLSGSIYYLYREILEIKW